MPWKMTSQFFIHSQHTLGRDLTKRKFFNVLICLNANFVVNLRPNQSIF